MSDLGERLIRSVRDIAAEMPDNIYHPSDGDRCVYVEGGEPSCLIGQALWVEEVIGPELELDSTPIPSPHSADRPNTTTFLNLADYLSLPLNGGEVEWLNMVQSCQDNDVPWGRAVDCADRNFVKAAV